MNPGPLQLSLEARGLDPRALANLSVFERIELLVPGAHPDPEPQSHYGALLDGAGAGIASRLDAFDTAQERAADEGT